MNRKITDAEIEALAALALEPEEVDEDGDPFPDVYLLLFPNDKARKRRVGGWYVPGTDNKMFVFKVKSPEALPGWSITHVPTMAALARIFLIDRAEALALAKACYDAGIAEGVPLDSEDRASIGAAWGSAVAKHVPQWKAERDAAP